MVTGVEPTDRWVLARRGPKAPLDPGRPYAATWEEEPDAAGALVPTAVVFLTNRECPFRCVMCDLWVNTLDETVPRGAIPDQIRAALGALPPARHVKLYNAGSFFDPQAIPPSDDEAIAETVEGFERVIVESHPAFLAGAYWERCVRFKDLLAGRLEVAIGLETAHPGVLARLNKRMTVDAFRRAADVLAERDIDLRAFILLNPPFLGGAEAVEWACRSLDVAAACGATACSVIPTRSGNGAMEALGDAFAPPRLRALETVIEYGISQARPDDPARCAPAGPAEAERRRETGPRSGTRRRVFADLWELERFFDCECSPRRAERLRAMNRQQQILEPVACGACARTGER